MSDKQIDYADKISKILRKAENAGTPQEAEAFFAKAQELMVRYAITEEELDVEQTDEIVERKMDFHGSYRKDLMRLAWAVMEANQLKGFARTDVYTGEKTANGGSKKADRMTIVGFKSDVSVTMALIQSLEIQALKEMKTWWFENKTQYQNSWNSRTDQWNARHSFIDGFTNTIYQRLLEARRLAQSSVDSESKTGRAELVLRSRAERVNDWFDEMHGGHIRKGKASRRGVNYTAQRDGGQAGLSADIGGTKLKGNRGQLGS